MASKWSRKRRIEKQLDELQASKDALSSAETCVSGLYQSASVHDTSNAACTESSSDDDEFLSTDCFYDSPDKNSSSEVETDSSCEEDDTCHFLSNWAIEFGITQNALSALLSGLHRRIPELPKDARTLMKSNVTITTKIVAGGDYHHFGIAESLRKLELSYQHNETIKMQVNIDGLPLFNKSSMQLWPILGMLEGTRSPFIIGLFVGRNKPKDVEEYLESFIAEVEVLEKGFDLKDSFVFLQVTCFICDAPARSFVKKTKSHTGYYGCDRCIQKGVHLNRRMTFPDTAAQLRSDSEFALGKYDEHQFCVPSVNRINLGLVNGFVLDYMHLVCLGVVRRLIVLWLKGPKKTRISFGLSEAISGKLCSLSAHMPSELSRNLRPLSELDYWKATDFRQFLIYSSYIALKDYLNAEVFDNYKCLMVAIYLLLSPAYCLKYASYAKELLAHFIEYFKYIYGEEYVVYNVHCLTHVADDVLFHQKPLDELSAFPFENFLGKIKRCVRKPQSVLQQLARRVQEGYLSPQVFQQKAYELKQPHKNGPVVTSMFGKRQFQQVAMTTFILKCSVGDNCVRANDKVCVVRNIFEADNQVKLLVQEFGCVEPVFTNPIDSTVIGMLKVSMTKRKLFIVALTDIQLKYVLMPYSEKTWMAVPLMHTSWYALPHNTLLMNSCVTITMKV